MVWTTPRLWVVGEMVTHTILNLHLRDNLNWLGTNHAHASGTAGMGSSSFLLPAAVIFTDAGAAAPVARGLKRNGTTLLFHTTSVNLINFDGATATASLRSLGSANGTQAGDGTHTHSSFGAA